MALLTAPLRRIIARQAEGFLKLGAHGWCLMVNLHLVPALLEEICAVVVAAVCVAESNIADVIAHEGTCTRAEVVAHGGRKQRMATRQHVYKHGLAGTVAAHDGQLLTGLKAKIYGSVHSPCRVSGHSLTNTYRSHYVIIIIMVAVALTPCHGSCSQNPSSRDTSPDSPAALSASSGSRLRQGHRWHP